MRRLVVLALVPVAALAVPAASYASWAAVARGSASLPAGRMVNASGLTATCASLTSPKSEVNLAWTASTSSYVDGYVIVRTPNAGGAATSIVVSGGRTAAAVDVPPVTNGSSYTYAIRATSSTTRWTTPLVAGTGTPTYKGTRCSTL